MDIQEVYNRALERHRAGNLAEAEKIYREILAQNPNYDRALNMLGVIAMQVGETAAAADLIGKAIAVQPAVAEYHLNRGAALDKLGKLDEAVNEYRQALSLKADYAQALSNLGNGLRRQGNLTEAVAVCRRALGLVPGFAEAHHNLGLALQSSGQIDAAIEELTQAVARQPKSMEFMHGLAGGLAAAGRMREAITAYRNLLGVKPINPGIWSELGDALRRSGQLEAAAAAWEQAVALKPDLARAHVQLGRARYYQQKPREAMESYRRALAVSDSADTHNDLGAALHAMRDWDGAIAEYQRALAMQPKYAEAYNNLGSALKQKGEFEEAMKVFDKALELRGDYAAAHWNRAMLLLLNGDYGRGWQEYEWRWHTAEIRPTKNPSSRPMWDSGPLGGRRVLLHTEQGLGDTIQFLRYVPEVVQRGGKIVLSVPAELRRLLRSTWPAESEVGAAIEKWTGAEETPPVHDVQCALMSLPLALKTTAETIPGKVPYLAADAELKSKWKSRLAGEGRLRVGLVWAGRRSHQRDLERSIALEQLAALAAARGAAWVSLQKGEAARQAKQAPMELIDWTEELGDMAETAALVENLDLIIGVDTAVAHLAGALGKPTWVLLPYVPDWRWGLQGSDSKWYPTMKLFRQKGLGDWSGAVSEMAEELKKFPAGGHT
jgi:tetratricopeptide (TPR) repeat protein